jgi:hypothetical protein
MKKLFLSSLIVITGCAILALAGCGGGGGSGGTAPMAPVKDGDLMVARLHTFMNTLAAGDPEAAQHLLSQRLQKAPVNEAGVYPLLVKDFGSRIGSGTGVISWNFTVHPDEIANYGDFALILARYQSGETELVIQFSNGSRKRTVGHR